MSNMLRILKMQIILALKRPMIQFCAAVQPILWAFFYYMFSKNSEDSIFWYVFVNSAMMNSWGIMVFTTVSDIDRDRTIGVLPYLLISATPFNRILCLRTITNLLISLFSTFVLFFICLMIWPVSSSAFLMPLILLIASLFLMAIFSHLLAILIAMASHSALLMNVIEYPIGIIAGLGFSISIFPHFAQKLAELVPFAYTIELLRIQVGLSSTPKSNLVSEWWLMALGTTLLLLLIFVFSRRMENSLMKKGTITWV